MRVRIVCYEDVHAWILGKFAIKLAENLTALGVAVDIAKQADRGADINHHIIYYDYDATVSSLDTVMVTHIDTDWKLERLAAQLKAAEMGVCMSRQVCEALATAGLPRDRLCFVNPAHDQAVTPRPLVLGITSKVQPSGCKRQHMLAEIAARISPAEFAFEIMGAGWGELVAALRGAGFTVTWHEAFDRDVYLRIIPGFDYYLYFGFDEGSMGTLDALAAGVPTIVTPQGFHLDIPGGITHGFSSVDELAAVLDQVAAPRRARIASVAGWTWRRYAKQHLLLWEHLLRRRQGQALPQVMAGQLEAMGVVQA